MKSIKSVNGKDLITIVWKNWEGKSDILALYKEEYRYGGGIALFMWDMTLDEPWGDITVNIPGAMLDDNEILLNEFISNDTIKALKGVIRCTGDVLSYNYGKYKLAEMNMDVVSRLPNQRELMAMINSEDDITPTL